MDGKPVKNYGGRIRNEAIKQISSEWIAFVDDDDTVSGTYVSDLKKQAENNDLVVFKMEYTDGLVLPDSDKLECCKVGISFAIRTSFIRKHSILFEDGQFEDWKFLEACMNAGVKMRISDDINYFVRPE